MSTAELTDIGLLWLGVFVLFPLVIIYAYGVMRFVLVVCLLIGDFMEAAKWRMRNWIIGFRNRGN